MRANRYLYSDPGIWDQDINVGKDYSKTNVMRGGAMATSLKDIPWLPIDDATYGGAGFPATHTGAASDDIMSRLANTILRLRMQVAMWSDPTNLSDWMFNQAGLQAGTLDDKGIDYIPTTPETANVGPNTGGTAGTGMGSGAYEEAMEAAFRSAAAGTALDPRIAFKRMLESWVEDILPPSGTTTVGEGQTLWGMYGSSWQEKARAAGIPEEMIENPHQLQPGDYAKMQEFPESPYVPTAEGEEAPAAQMWFWKAIYGPQAAEHGVNPLKQKLEEVKPAAEALTKEAEILENKYKSQGESVGAVKTQLDALGTSSGQYADNMERAWEAASKLQNVDLPTPPALDLNGGVG